MGRRVGPLAVALAVLGVAWLRMLIVTGADDPLADWSAVCGALAGPVVSLFGAVPLAGAVWAAAGGEVTQVVVGAGPRVWFRRAASGRLVSVHALPITVVVAGMCARPGRGPRAPFVAVVAYWGVLGVGGAVALLGQGLIFGLGAGAFILAVAHLTARAPLAYGAAAVSAAEARRRTRLGPVVRAAQRGDRADVLRRTADLPAVPEHWTDSFLLALRAEALASPTEAAQLLRAALAEPTGTPQRTGTPQPTGTPRRGGVADPMAPLLRVELTSALFQALLRGEVPPEHRAAVAAEIRARVGDRSTLRRPAVIAHQLAAIGAYVDGRWPAAVARSVAAARATPPGLAGDEWALASLACAASGDRASAAGYLDTAVRDDPDAVLIPAARAALSPARA